MSQTNTRFIALALLGSYFAYCALTPEKWHFIDSVNLIFHEAGHTIFFFLGEFLQVFMGSGFQVALPLLIAWYFYRNQQLFEGVMTLLWAGQSLINVSIYVGDALVMQLPLLGDGMHDWNYLLSTLGVLSLTPIVAGIFYAAGAALIVAGIMYGWRCAEEASTMRL